MACIGGQSAGSLTREVDDALGQFAVAGQHRLEFGQLLGVGKVIMVQQVHHLFRLTLAGQLVDVVSAVDQLPDVATDVAQACAAMTLQVPWKRWRQWRGFQRCSSANRFKTGQV